MDHFLCGFFFYLNEVVEWAILLIGNASTVGAEMVDFCWEKDEGNSGLCVFIGLNFTLPKSYNLDSRRISELNMHFQSSVDGASFSSQESLFSVPVSCLAGWRVRDKGRWRCLAIGQDLWRSFFSFVPCRRHFEMLLIWGFPLRLGRRLPLLRGVAFPLKVEQKWKRGPPSPLWNGFQRGEISSATH